MFDPKAIMIAQIRYEEERSKVQYERILQRQIQRPSLHQHALAGIGRLMVVWGTSLQARYGEARARADWTGANRRLGRAL